MNKNYQEGRNRLLLILCILLFILFGALLFWSRSSNAADAARLQELAAREEQKDQAEEQDASEEARPEETVEEETEENQEQASTGQQNSENEDQESAAEETATAPTLAKGIVCWGDDLINGEESATHSYRAVLQNLLNDSGYNLTVIDKTLQGAGTLSMMTMAGVPQEEVQSYITAHQEAAQGQELPVTETGIRDLTQEQTQRNDLEYVPVIFMGYYGGWNHDPAELARQQEAILNTFPQQEQYIIAGTFPLDGSVDSATLDSVMSEKWGEHYISVASITSNPASTYEGQADLAAAILQKMKDLGYLA